MPFINEPEEPTNRTELAATDADLSDYAIPLVRREALIRSPGGRHPRQSHFRQSFPAPRPDQGPSPRRTRAASAARLLLDARRPPGAGVKPRLHRQSTHRRYGRRGEGVL